MMVPQSSSTSPFCLNPSPLNQSKEVLKISISVFLPKSSMLKVVMKNNKGALQEQALFEMLQALREAEMLNFIICLKYIIPQV
ncbi:hypothetical protein HanXRQr2_Chr06g0241631 [Helianthus annuus]|uniref:Uncharacterized protein n=2 Tax=Helianthus annuus TaxID=4232 RepID=A0A251UFT7_HELAN|nr:hypothetical protein HanXRQr2_Chr06g0241611 [Helianthus annuus]KAF5800872.1 hypothetical protein HanXRQr2_Chr06g0241631 [Helianthus annuus]KAJ0559250.1 hypothetical protein HanHA300_Chr06g0198271 [Helianthus annuus]KAJ0559252.1 hypothetical protein HanHA300_Chr06g0198291 [Helianthus annuus]KAJ0559254.1 hypothetical protein HanHA300_Chr06g0198311 [Helianthus annuus]